ncbi:Retrovirus-related Pol polyprotein LINE-1 [Cricetulus griseus]|uniref:Retrovirus-related Pol polyprotein LINE-1 n=1 Tax=Cricetulus griseus TaxID=10029 RepID=G3H3G4_CRIGR|nr:Retrovirus-related Pol polyprotein LINE-1 [Cricetulus griseus]
MRSKRTAPLLVGVATCTSALEISVVVSQKIRNQSTPQDAPSHHKDTCSTMFTAALFVIARTWEQPRCPSTEEWMEKMWYIYTMEH